MKSNKIKLLLLFAMLNISIIVVLFLLSENPRLTKRAFLRILPPHALSNSHEFILPYNSYFISGVAKTSVYIGNKTSTIHLLTSDYALSKTDSVKISIKDSSSFLGGILHLSVDSPNFSLTEGVTPAIMLGTLDEKTAIRYPINTPRFTDLLRITDSLFVVNVFDSSLKQNILRTIKIGVPLNDLKQYILKKQLDGVFCVDGSLHYDPFSGHIIYVYYYRNQFVCLDSNLNTVFEGHTIDTVTNANIQLGRIDSEHMIVFAKPPLTVNIRSCVSNNLLFVHSALIADNESKKIFKNNSVIDVYSLKNGRYKYSFYLPDIDDSKVRDFRVVNKHIIVIYKKTMLSYKLNYD